MATGRDNLTSSRDEASSTSSSRLSRDILSRVDAYGTLTRLKLVEQARADAFWKRFSFPPQIRVSFSTSGLQFVACTDKDRDAMNFIY